MLSPGTGVPRLMGFGRRALAAATGAAMVVTLAACGGQALGTTRAAHVGGPVATKNTDSSGRPAPDGTFTTLEGKRAAVSSFRGSPALLWFISGGCASCAVSIPAVAQRLASFARARVHVLVLGLYGAFDQGARGLTELDSFGQAAAGRAFSNPTWTWGLASAGLTAAYDPEGVPDDYFLLDGAGQVVYHNTVPISTMAALLTHVSSLTGARIRPAFTAVPVPTLP
jgi:hypothetical protein